MKSLGGFTTLDFSNGLFICLLQFLLVVTVISPKWSTVIEQNYYIPDRGG